MAIDINMWEKDGPNGESLIKSIRIKSINQIPEIVQYWSGISDCVRITKDRSDKQSNITHDLWIRPGYIDPFI